MKGRNFDLEQRTLDFAVQVISYCKKLQITEFNRALVQQVIRSATSVGANYSEAAGASSPKDFRNKISLSRKEAKETLYWLQLLSKLENIDFQEVITESEELCKIFGRSISTLDNKQ